MADRIAHLIAVAMSNRVKDRWLLEQVKAQSTWAADWPPATDGPDAPDRPERPERFSAGSAGPDGVPARPEAKTAAAKAPTATSTGR